MNVEKKLESINVIFPIRSHSYLETDKNVGLINKKASAIIPEDWVTIIKNAQQKPSNLKLSHGSHFFRGWTESFDETYIKKSPFPSRQIRETVSGRGKRLKFRTSLLLTSYNGTWQSASIMAKNCNRNRHSTSELGDGEFELLDYCYEGNYGLLL